MYECFLSSITTPYYFLGSSLLSPRIFATSSLATMRDIIEVPHQKSLHQNGNLHQKNPLAKRREEGKRTNVSYPLNLIVG